MLKNSVSIKKGDIELIIYDFDGVMTDNRVLIFPEGKEAVFCNRSDGLAVEKIKSIGIRQVIMSTEPNKVASVRAKKLKIEAICNIADKKKTVLDYCRRRRINLCNVAYVGNDINDLEAMKLVGYPVAPQDAYDEVKKLAKIVFKSKGGYGVVRELYGILIR